MDNKKNVKLVIPGEANVFYAKGFSVGAKFLAGKIIYIKYFSNRSLHYSFGNIEVNTKKVAITITIAYFKDLENVELLESTNIPNNSLTYEVPLSIELNKTLTKKFLADVEVLDECSNEFSTRNIDDQLYSEYIYYFAYNNRRPYHADDLFISTEEDIEKYAHEEKKEFDASYKASYLILNSNVDPVITNLPHAPVSIRDLFLSRTYSQQADKTIIFYTQSLKELLHIPFAKDAVQYLALTMAQSQEMPIVKRSLTPWSNHYINVESTSEHLKFIDPINDSNLVNFSHIGRNNCGHYSTRYNVVVNNLQDRDTFAHELVHATMNIMFGNFAKPYPSKDKYNIQDSFNDAFLQVRKNIAVKFSGSEDILHNTKAKSFYDSPELFNFFYNHNANEAKEMKCLHNLLTVFFDDAYLPSDRDAELVAKFVELRSNGCGTHFFDKYLSPIERFWSEHITPKVEQMLQYHSERCNNDYANEYSKLVGQGFEFCIAELL